MFCKKCSKVNMFIYDGHCIYCNASFELGNYPLSQYTLPTQYGLPQEYNLLYQMGYQFGLHQVDLYNQYYNNFYDIPQYQYYNQSSQYDPYYSQNDPLNNNLYLFDNVYTDNQYYQ
ncbi:MAG: hypothetical protein LBU60_05365 [Clostridiales bacterium]|jgi:hypothetical protein|nr:hypothetical protein [Clostridiales bacterium]